jgi:hypothetical protein
MEMILDDNDLVIGASFENGTIQDYVDDNKTYGLIRFEDTTANWFLFNKEDSTEDIQELYKKITKDGEHYIHDEYGEEVVIFNKNGKITYEILLTKIDDYLNDGIF